MQQNPSKFHRIKNSKFLIVKFIPYKPGFEDNRRIFRQLYDYNWFLQNKERGKLGIEWKIIDELWKIASWPF